MSGRFLLKIIIKKALVGDDVRFRDIVLIVSLLVHTQHFYFSFFFSSSRRWKQEADRDADNTPTTSAWRHASAGICHASRRVALLHR